MVELQRSKSLTSKEIETDEKSSYINNEVDIDYFRKKSVRQALGTFVAKFTSEVGACSRPCAPA